MIDLIQTQPNAINAGFGNTIFYYGVEPHGLSRLPSRSEFTLVYSPSQEYGWEVVHYRVLQSNKTYFVVDRRDLSEQEMQYFERLLENVSQMKSDGHFNDQQRHTGMSATAWTKWLAAYASIAWNLISSNTRRISTSYR